MRAINTETLAEICKENNYFDPNFYKELFFKKNNLNSENSEAVTPTFRYYAIDTTTYNIGTASDASAVINISGTDCLNIVTKIDHFFEIDENLVIQSVRLDIYYFSSLAQDNESFGKLISSVYYKQTGEDSTIVGSGGGFGYRIGEKVFFGAIKQNEDQVFEGVQVDSPRPYLK